MQIPMVSGSGEGRPNWRERAERELRGFRGPIAVAAHPPAGSVLRFGGENENGQPFSLHITYSFPDGGQLLIRTKAAPLPPDPENPPPFITIDTLHNAFGIYGHAAYGAPPPVGLSPSEAGAWRHEQIVRMRRAAEDFEQMPRVLSGVPIDGTVVQGFRMDYPDCSGIELDWNGTVVQCVSTADVIDGLELRTADDGDLAELLRPIAP